MEKHFVNLTNGIEAINEYHLIDFSYIRIQSTACEQKRWDFILIDLDYTFLMSLALGYKCIVYDYGANKKCPRAVWQGCNWIKYALSKGWLNEDIDVFSRSGHNMRSYFFECYENLSPYTMKKIKYFKKFLNTKNINLRFVSGNTIHDGDYEYYRQLLF